MFPLLIGAAAKAQLTEAGTFCWLLCDRSSPVSGACRSIEISTTKGGSCCGGAQPATGTLLMPAMIGLFRAKYPMWRCRLQCAQQPAQPLEACPIPGDLEIIGGRAASELKRLLQVVPYANDNLPW